MIQIFIQFVVHLYKQNSSLKDLSSHVKHFGPKHIVSLSKWQCLLYTIYYHPTWVSCHGQICHMVILFRVTYSTAVSDIQEISWMSETAVE